MARAALDSKAEDVVVLDLRKLSYSFDFFVICDASSDRRMHSIAEEIEETLLSNGTHSGHIEGKREGTWILLDHGSVVGHIFSPETRRFYDLERLWADAPRVKITHKKKK